MSWVLAPLLLAALVAAVVAWRGRLPGRTALNAWSSLLLLVYLGTTAGLGIFWVANQHLPVFKSLHDRPLLALPPAWPRFPRRGTVRGLEGGLKMAAQAP